MAVDVSKHLERAKRHLEKNKLEEAAEAYQSVLSEVPGHIEALQALGDLYGRINQPDRAATYYSILFDRFFDAREENKALAIYTRVLKGVQQPAERMMRYALLLRKQNRVEEAIDQYSLASELFLAQSKEEAALDCLERVAQLDPENSDRQAAIAELAQRLGKHAVAARGFLRAGQVLDAGGNADRALEMFARAHQLVPKERSPALVYAQALLRRGDAEAAVQLLEPLSAGELDASFMSAFGEALARSGKLDRARGMLEQLPAEQPDRATRLFDLADRYLVSEQEQNAVAVLRSLQTKMAASGHQKDFATRLDALMEGHSDSIPMTEFWAATYGQMNREAKYFEVLTHLFDLYMTAGNIPGACDTFEKLIDIDAYDSRSEERIGQLEGRADAAFVYRMRNRLGQSATHGPEAPLAPAGSGPVAAPGDSSSERQSLEDMIVQAEIFLQYSLQPKAIERLQKIAELFPGQERENERLRNLFQMANWWPPGAAQDPGAAPPKSAEQAESAASAAESADTLRDLAKISEISRALFRLPTPRAILSSGINEMGHHLRVRRCIGVIGAAGKPPQLASEFCAPGVQPASGALLVRLLAQLEHATTDALGGLVLEAASAPVLHELGLETALGVVLLDRETQAHAGVTIAGYETPHVWRAHETYFLQAVSDQILLGVNHARLRTHARAIGVADEQTGLLARSSYQECLLAEAQRAKSQGSPVALILVQVDRGAELLRRHGDAQLESYVQQLARGFINLIRQTDMVVKYNAWTIALILPSTGLAGAQKLEEKLRATRAEIHAPWDGNTSPTSSASIAEAVTRPDYDTEDIVTELINRAEAGLEEAVNRGGDSVVALNAAQS